MKERGEGGRGRGGRGEGEGVGKEGRKERESREKKRECYEGLLQNARNLTDLKMKYSGTDGLMSIALLSLARASMFLPSKLLCTAYEERDMKGEERCIMKLHREAQNGRCR